jgi:RHS repeat-associated protein
VRSSSSPKAWDALCKEWRGPIAREVVQVDVLDPEGRLVRRTDGAGHVTEFGYDSRGRLSRSRNARGLNTWWGFDALGNLAWDVAFSGEGSPLYGGEPAETKNVLELTRYEHDILGRTTSIARLHALHTASGDLARVRDGYARVTTDYESGGSGERKTVVTDDGGHQTTLTYDMLGRLTQELLPTSQVVTHAYPSELLEVIESPASDGPPVKRTIARDGRGLPVREEDSTGKVLWSAEYDSRGLATKLTLESGGSWVYKWDGFGRLVAKTGYDASGSVLSTESREYDLNDNLSAVVDGQGHRTSYQFDALDRLVEETLADGSRYVVEKYVGGSALPEVDTTPAARRTYSYDEDGALIGLRAESRAQILLQTFWRDLLGRPIEVHEQTWDLSGQLTPGSHSMVSLGWDTLGNRVYERRSVDGEAPAGGVTRFVTGDGVAERSDLEGASIVRYFGAFRRLTTAQVVGGQGGHEVILEYRGLGGESVLRAQVHGREVSRTETMRDGRERIESIEHRFASGAHNQLESPSFKDGWPTGFSRTDASSGQLDMFSQELDPIGRLRNERHARNGLEDYSAYELDRADNWSAMSAVKNIGGRAELAGTPELTATNGLEGGLPGAAKIALDSAGRVTGVDSNRTFSYDPLGRLVQATSGQSTSRFVYDAFGRLSREVTDGVQYDFTPDGDQIVAETRNADPSTTTYFVHGDGLDRPLFRVQGGKAAFYHWGADGSLSFVSDQSGELIEKYSYSAYGERSVEDASGNAIPDSLIGNRYGYRGQMYHAATGLYWMRARWYEPKWGRFLTPDPIGLAGGQNRYMYVNASPTLFWDPFGLDPNSAGDDAPRGEMSALDTMDPSDAWRTGVVQGMKDRGAELGRTLWDQVRNPSWKYFAQNMFTPVGAYRGVVGLVGAVAGAGRDLSRGFDAFVRGDARGTGYYLNWGIGESALLAISGRGLVATGKLAATGPSVGRIGGGSGPWVPSVTRQGGAVAQTAPGSCGSACAEMLSGGARTQAQVLAEIGEWASAGDVAGALGPGWRAGYFGSGADAVTIAGRGPMGGVLWAPGARAGHMVVIEPGPAGFLIRDPLPGVNYTVGANWIERWVAGGLWQ